MSTVRRAVIEALARRAEAQQGEARRVMMLRVETAAARRTGRVDGRCCRAGRIPGAPGRAGGTVRTGGSTRALADVAAPAPRKVQPSPTPVPAPRNAVTAFRSTWSRLRAEQRLREALAQVPAMAGPLNSSHIVNRTLRAMHGLSPEYLDAFMPHVDTLLRLEQASGGDVPIRTGAPAERGRRR
jgi:hypothetical protein